MDCFLSLKRTEEGALVLFARPKKKYEDICLLDYVVNESNQPGICGVFYALTLCGTRQLAMATQVSSYHSEHVTIQNLGVSAARVAADMTGKDFDNYTVSTELFVSSSDVESIKRANAWFGSLKKSHNSVADVSEFIAMVLAIDDSKPLFVQLCNHIVDYGIFFLGPVCRQFFLDSILAVARDPGNKGEGKKFLAKINEYTRCSNIKETESLPLDLGLNYEGFKTMAQLLFDTCLASGGLRTSAFGMLIVFAILNKAFVVPTFHQQVATHVAELVEKRPDVKAILDRAGIKAKEVVQ